MNTSIQKGSILIADGTRIPTSFHTEAGTPVLGWQLVQNLDRHSLLRTIGQAGGKLFDRGTAVETWAFGFNYRRTLHKAINYLVGNIRTKSFNCLEIQQVEARRCLGFPYLFVSVHSWHIQESNASSRG